MNKECFMCGQSAQGRYTLVLDNSKIIEDVVVCEECISDLRNTEWIEVYE
jgi:ribosome-binding protein aMBF1 (putative translation factor)